MVHERLDTPRAHCSIIGEFFCSNGRRLGDKEELVQSIHEVTRIPVTVLLGADLSAFDVSERLLWAQGRETMRPEDMAYSLLGIFGIHMSLIYGRECIMPSIGFNGNSIGTPTNRNQISPETRF